MSAGLPLPRRQVLSLAALGIAGPVLAATPSLADGEPATSLPLWPGVAPGGPPPEVVERLSAGGSVKGITQPRIEMYRPDRPGRLAMLVMAGGGYAHLERGHESRPACRWLASRGILAFDLVYRLPGDGWTTAAPFLDAARAMRLVRAEAARVGIAQVGVLGFSAGGHLAGMTAVRPDLFAAPTIDAADREDARPDLAVLLYPVIDLRPSLPPTRSRRELLGPDPGTAEADRLSVDAQVTPKAPPTFLAQSFDDPVSSIDNSLRMAAALHTAGVPVELHAFTTGGHGWGMGRPGSAPTIWPDLVLTWLNEIGLPAAGVP